MKLTNEGLDKFAEVVLPQSGIVEVDNTKKNLFAGAELPTDDEGNFTEDAQGDLRLLVNNVRVNLVVSDQFKGFAQSFYENKTENKVLSNTQLSIIGSARKQMIPLVEKRLTELVNEKKTK